jgi:hypothetical protein
MIALPPHGLPVLRPLRHVDAARSGLSRVLVADAVAIVIDGAEKAAEAAERRRIEREARASRPWSPPFRCNRCHRYVSSATSACKGCGHVGATCDEGQRTSYARAHRRHAA